MPPPPLPNNSNPATRPPQQQQQNALLEQIRKGGVKLKKTVQLLAKTKSTPFQNTTKSDDPSPLAVTNMHDAILKRRQHINPNESSTDTSLSENDSGSLPPLPHSSNTAPPQQQQPPQRDAQIMPPPPPPLQQQQPADLLEQIRNGGRLRDTQQPMRPRAATTPLTQPSVSDIFQRGLVETRGMVKTPPPQETADDINRSWSDSSVSESSQRNEMHR